MNSIVLVDKPISKTCYEMITLLKKTAQYENAVLGYAGRLDPMAEGLLLILVDEENKKRKHYERLPKVYEATFAFGVATDTYDVMGIITHTAKAPSQEEVNSALASLQGTFTQAYPPYSARRVNGKPLFYWAREGKIAEIAIPEKEVTVSKIEITNTSSISPQELVTTIEERITKVNGKFRQEEILKQWHEFAKTTTTPLPTVTTMIHTSGGVYIRSLANALGENTNSASLLINLKRVQIGNYKLEDAKRL